MDTDIIRKRARKHEAVLATKLAAKMGQAVARKVLAQFRASVEEICEELETGRFQPGAPGFPGEKLARAWVYRQIKG